MDSAAGHEHSSAARPAGRRRREVGLHGHSLEGNAARLAVVELLGTFILVLAIIGTAIAATLNQPVAGPAYNSVTVPLAGGLALTACVAGFGPLSGAHLNPAVTIGLALNRGISWKVTPIYLAAQLCGAIGAALVAWGLYGGSARTVAHLGATYPASGVGAWRTFATEAVVTFILVLIIVAVATDPRVPAGVAALAIGFALAVAIFISGPLTGGAVNPARALGPMIVAGKFTDWWCYLLGPLLGGAVAVTLYESALAPGVPQAKEKAAGA